MISAQGGTFGPSTSHMIIAARSRSALGPWENSPYNPMLRTWSRRERWWSQGHGTLIDDLARNWWVIYHAIENGQRTLGRQTLMMPVEWSDDGWPLVTRDHVPNDMLPKPAGNDVGHGMPLSDDFADLGLQWRYWETGDAGDAYQCAEGALYMAAKGDDLASGSWLACLPVNKAYEVQVEVRCPKGAQAGLIIRNEHLDQVSGLSACEGRITAHARSYGGPRTERLEANESGRVYLKLRNLYHDLALYYSLDGREWVKLERSASVEGYKTNHLGLFACGEGVVEFRHFRYQGLD